MFFCLMLPRVWRKNTRHVSYGAVESVGCADAMCCEVEGSGATPVIMTASGPR